MSDLLVLASELGEKTLWNPTILGFLVVISAVVLFCGSVYLLLGTNMGARLGFLVAAAGLTGLLALLSIVWFITATPLNSPRGSQATWEPVEVVATYSGSSVDVVAAIERGGEAVSEDSFGDIRPSVEAALVTSASEEGESSELALVGDTSDIIPVSSYETGGGSRWAFWHEPKYQAVEFCLDDDSDDDVAFDELAPDPMCDAELGNQVIVFERDLGTLRQPPAMFLIAFSILFALSLAGLHWREKDLRAAAAAEAE